MKIAIILALTWPLAAQQVSIGAIGGVNLTPDINEGRQTYSGGSLPSGATQITTLIYRAPSPRPIIGLKLELAFGRQWSLEIDALRREVRSTQLSLFSPPLLFPTGQEFSQFPPGGVTQTLTPWEFPVLAKYRPIKGAAKIRPLIMAGPSFRPAGTGTSLSHVGVTVGAGIELRVAAFRIEPQLRYTRWTGRGLGDSVGAPNLNQLEFFVGFDRPSRERVPFSVFGQRLSVGVIAGVGLGSDFRAGVLSSQQKPEANSGIYGLMLEAPLGNNWALEVDGLYRPLHGTDVEFNRRVRFAHLTWEFPVLAKYRLPLNRRLRAFFEGGPSFRSEGNLNLQSVSHFGATVGGGVETTIARLKIAPTFRYTRWGNDDHGGARSETLTNQAQLLLSFSF